MNVWMIVGLYYGIAALLIVFAVWFYRLINQPAFRNDSGDVSTEVGYEEDSYGNVFTYACDDFSHAHPEPHIHATGNTGSGPM